MSCGAGCRRGSDPALLWVWCRPAATAPIGPLAGELPYAAGAALEKAKRQQMKRKEKNPQSASLSASPIVTTQLFFFKDIFRSSCVAQRVKNPNGIHEDAGSSPALAQWVKDQALP